MTHHWPILLRAIALAGISLLTAYAAWQVVALIVQGSNSNERDDHDD